MALSRSVKPREAAMNRRRGVRPSTEQEAPSGDPPSGAASDSTQGRQPPRPMAWAPRDLLIPYILLAVSLQRAHGYFIEEYLKRLGLVGVDKSVLYRTLRHLEHDGLVVSAWEPGPAGPAR